MGSIHNPFPIDLTLAEMVFPALAAAAHSLDHVPHFYESTDGFFTRNFLGLFTNPEAPLPLPEQPLLGYPDEALPDG